VEYAVQPADISPGPCPHCGNEMEWKAKVGGIEKGPETHFFQCKGCDYIRTLEGHHSGADANH
jgi:DNA-directed RNA polymerase subunit M/transcription elongation factor TFIIS